MPKLKTHRGAKKRFKVTTNKKILHQKSNKSHILTKKAAKRKRNLGKPTLISRVDRDKIKRMLPYEF
ncbi:MAG: 50S ribosomal protein L35 [Candidatus Aminicenantes bacterium 4484_214]|nr:MAG: 50S ribosomal protein L35 [Candidatus Aminicenantes bacterium 4484_214]RLE09205.1 MAG: 50S ribosomal protein L35 [Candidatus Aminicenantes bacterium]HDJ24327.1 50S ribosomal protein L35 [Candidatus Aminicenantes bacterium]